MTDQFRVVSSQGWFSRLGASIKGLLLGGILFLASFPVLWWNEGRAVKTHASLQEGRGAVRSVPAETADPANDSRLVHLSGLATTGETVVDPVFGVAEKAIRLKRTAETYQWVEKKRSETRKKLGGGEETVTTCTYSKDWSDQRIDSGHFERPEGHANPVSLAFESESWTARLVTLGAFHLSDGLARRMDRSVEVGYTQAALDTLPGPLKGRARIEGAALYLGRSPLTPAVGDVRIRFHKVAPQDVSVLARQDGTRLGPYPTQAGDPIEALAPGVVSADAMFKGAEKANTVATWALRCAGFLLMMLAMLMLLRPLRVLADVVPAIGVLVGLGLGLVAFAVAAPLTLLTIGVAWIAHRPLLAISLVATAAVIGAWLLSRLAFRRRMTAPAVA